MTDQFMTKQEQSTVIGLGYVGLWLALTRSFRVITNADRVAQQL